MTDRSSRRELPGLVAIGAVWLGVVALAAFGALVNRPSDAGVGAAGSFYLAFLTIPGIVVALVLIRTRAILIATAAVAGMWSATLSWIIMHATSKHAAIGILVTAMIALVLVGVGCGVDFAYRRSAGA